MWLLLILLVVVVAVVVVYNSLVRLRELGEGAWSDIDVQLKRRHDLVPNLVETVKGYAGHERDTLESVIQARSRAISADGPAARARAEAGLTDALRHLFVLSESYPELRATENFRHLQTTLVDLEDAIQKARRYYNAVVRDYNTRVQQVPSNLVAGLFGFDEREFFGAADEERSVPEVRLQEGER